MKGSDSLRYFLREGLPFPATCRAIATAWRWSFPAAISVLMFRLTVARLDPRFNGMMPPHAIHP